MSKWIPALLVLLVLLVFGSSLWAGLVWDDHDLLEHNALVTGYFSIIGLLRPYWAEAGGLEVVHYNRPLVTLSFALQHDVHGLSPAGYHLANVLFHAVAVVALYRLLRAFALTAPAAGLAAAFFAVFPTQVEPVAWISGRTDLLAGGLGFLAMGWHGRARGFDRYAAAAGLALLGSILSKEIGWVFVPLLVMQRWLELRPVVADGPDAVPPSRLRRRSWIPIGLAVLAGIAVRLVSLGTEGDSASATPLWVIPLRVITSAGHYLSMLAWPWNPSALPAGRALAPPTSILFWAGILALVVTPWLAWRSARQGDRRVAFALLWILLGLFPVLNLVPLPAPSPVAERFWYVPLGGVAMLLGIGAERGVTRAGARAALTGPILLLLMPLAATSISRVPDWTSDRTLWEAEARRHGLRHPLAARNLGLARLKEGDKAGAERVWREALEAGLGGGSSHYFDIGINLGNLLVSQGRGPEAAGIAGTLLKLRPPAEKRTSLEAILQEARTNK